MAPAETLKCCRCGQQKTADEFAWRRRGRQRDTMCRPCRSAYGKEHYAANRQRYIDQAKARKQLVTLERTRWLIDYFATHPCVDCGETDPVVLEFDHIRDKSFAIGPKLAQASWKGFSPRSISARWSARTAIAAAPRSAAAPSARS